MILSVLLQNCYVLRYKEICNNPGIYRNFTLLKQTKIPANNSMSPSSYELVNLIRSITLWTDIELSKPVTRTLKLSSVIFIHIIHLHLSISITRFQVYSAVKVAKTFRNNHWNISILFYCRKYRKQQGNGTKKARKLHCIGKYVTVFNATASFWHDVGRWQAEHAENPFDMYILHVICHDSIQTLETWRKYHCPYISISTVRIT